MVFGHLRVTISIPTRRSSDLVAVPAGRGRGDMPRMDVLFVYITTGSRDEALSIGRTLVEEGLAACANVLGEMTSIYRWQGDRKSTRLNSSHVSISYAVFCLYK